MFLWIVTVRLLTCLSDLAWLHYTAAYVPSMAGSFGLTCMEIHPKDVVKSSMLEELEIMMVLRARVTNCLSGQYLLREPDRTICLAIPVLKSTSSSLSFAFASKSAVESILYCSSS